MSIGDEMILKLLDEAEAELYSEKLHEFFVSFVENNPVTSGDYMRDTIIVYMGLRKLLKDLQVNENRLKQLKQVYKQKQQLA